MKRFPKKTKARLNMTDTVHVSEMQGVLYLFMSFCYSWLLLPQVSEQSVHMNSAVQVRTKSECMSWLYTTRLMEEFIFSSVQLIFRSFLLIPATEKFILSLTIMITFTAFDFHHFFCLYQFSKFLLKKMPDRKSVV